MIARVAGGGFTSRSWENVLPICLLSLCILRLLLSPDSHGSAKCSSIQGSFHVPVTLLEPLYAIAHQLSLSPFQVLLFILCGWWSFALRACLCACLIACVLRVCVSMYECTCSCGDRCAYILQHEYMCVYTFPLRTCSCLYTACVLRCRDRPACILKRVCVCLCQHI